ncbi:cell number regulator 7 [Hevea brasiliensis]|uniref:cell number regulator 7 n=1 Tax=Hevea brasiliensis TaxID=3981 RepID=UPI0025D8E9E5|nr:cell number regulator 7 [Hevea brasiliensis]
MSHSTWSTGLCGCCEDPGVCLRTCFFPCVTFGQNAEAIDKTSCACARLLFCALCFLGVPCLYSFTYRIKLRGNYLLPGETCGDCCIHCWCLHCALCQEYREIKNRGLDPSRGVAMAPPAVAQGMPR